MQERLLEGTSAGWTNGTFAARNCKNTEAYVANLKQPKQLERISPIGDKAEVPETLKGIGTPKTGNVREWDDQDRQAWAAMRPQRKKDGWRTAKP